MTIFINTLPPYRDKIMIDLMMICPDPGMTFNLTTGQVFFKQTVPLTPGSTLIEDLSLIPGRVLVRAAPLNYSFSTEGNHNTMRDALGICIPTGAPPAITGAEIVYDGTSCDGKGAWAAGIDTFSVGNPSHCILFHELTHADRMLRGEEVYTDATKTKVSPDEEDEVVRLENLFRATLFGIGLRNPDLAASGGCNPPPEPPKPPKKADEKPVTGIFPKAYTIGGKCFIATAAYGSPMEPRVEFLRRFREDVLRQTRSGHAFFEEFYRQYYQVSPEIAEYLLADSRVMDVMRLAVVEPIVQHLQLANRFPDAPLDDVPEPWRSFLQETRDALQTWSDPLGLPYTFRDLPVSDAVAELAVVLRYLTRSPERRAGYLDRLTLLEEIPFQVDAGEWEGLASVLRGAGRSDDDIACILGPMPGEARA